MEAIYKDTDFIISLHSGFFKNLQDVNHVVIIGWYAGGVDRPYLKKIKESVDKNTKWTAYWYDNETYNSLSATFADVGIKDNNENEDSIKQLVKMSIILPLLCLKVLDELDVSEVDSKYIEKCKAIQLIKEKDFQKFKDMMESGEDYIQ